MRTAELQRLLPRLEAVLAQAREVRQRIEDAIEGPEPAPGDAGDDGDPKAELENVLRSGRTLAHAALDLAYMHGTGNALASAWASYEREGLQKVTYLPEHMHAQSLPLEHLVDIAEALRLAVGGGGIDEYELRALERLLRSTAVLVKKRNVVPTREHDVQAVMHDYLEAAFDDYKHPVHIDACPIKGFEPDGGVIHLRAGIEFKYATTKQEVKGAVSGILEDVGGYGGSADWNRFFAVIFQTEAFFAEGPVEASIVRVGGTSWTPIIVTGRGR